MKHSWLTLALAVAIPGVYYLAFGNGHLAEIQRLHGEIHRHYENSSFAEDQNLRLAELEGTLARLESWRDDLRSRTTCADGPPPFLLQTSATLQSFGLETERAAIVPDLPTPPFSSQQLGLVVHGSFPDLFRFIQHVERESPPRRVTSLDIRTTEPSRIRADITLTCLWSTEP